MARITMKLATAACTAALGAAAFADAAREWTGATSADLSVAENWSELAGGTDNVSYFKKDATGLTLAADYAFPGGVLVNADGIHLSFDLGAGRTLTFPSTYYCDANNTTVELLSGTYENTASELVLLSSSSWGVVKKGNTFRIKGKDAFLKATKNVIFSYNSQGCTFEMDDGAKFEGQFRFGNANPKDMTIRILNGATLTTSSSIGFFSNARTQSVISNATVTMAGTRDASSVGADATLDILDGGVLKITSSPFSINGTRAKVRVDGKGSTISASQIFVGLNKGGEDTLTITNGAYVSAASGVYVGGNNTTKQGGGWLANGSSCSNLLHVTGNAVLACGGTAFNTEALTIGDLDNETNGWSRLLVDAGGVVSNTTWYSTAVGWSSSFNRFDLKDGFYSGVGNIRLGWNATSVGNVLSVTDGGELMQNGGPIHVGYAGSSNLCEVLDGTLTFGNGQICYVGYTNCVGNVLRIGEKGKFLGRDKDVSDVAGKIYVGNAAGETAGREGRLEVLGGRVEISSISLGYGGSADNALVVSNGTIAATSLYLADGGTRNSLVVKGTNSLVSVNGAAGATAKTGTEITFDFADGAYASAPLRGLGTSGWAFQDGATVKFANVAALRQGSVRKCELVRNDQKAISISDATLAAWRAALPDGCSLKLSSDKKALTFALKDGLMLIVR